MDQLAFAYLEAIHDDPNPELAYSIKEEMLSRAGNHTKVYLKQASETRKICGLQDKLQTHWLNGESVKA